MAALALKSLASLELTNTELGLSWWDEINESTQWQNGIFYGLCAAYALISAVALIQLLRISSRVSTWTTQKVFILMNFIVTGVRASIFGFHIFVFALKPKVLTLVLLDFPGLLFFTTYTLLVLFWAEIYYQAGNHPTDKLRAWYIGVNCVVYIMQGLIWLLVWIHNNSFVETIGQISIAVVSFIAALGFLLYGGRLFVMLRHFPVESKGRRQKIYECFCKTFKMCGYNGMDGKVPTCTANILTWTYPCRLDQLQQFASVAFSSAALWLCYLPLILKHLLKSWIIQFWISYTTRLLRLCLQHLSSTFCERFLQEDHHLTSIVQSSELELLPSPGFLSRGLS